jgi:site-specific DNA-methyltransferase (adenine-specific)
VLFGGGGEAILKILQGDCLKLMRELPDNSVHMIFTDPPYGHNNNDGDLIANWEKALGQKPKGEPEARPIANDGVEANDLFRQFLVEARRVLVPGSCCCCCCGGGGPDPQFARWSLWMDEIFDFKQMIIWDKGPIGMGWHYRRSYETVLVGQKPGAACKWYDDTQQIENIIRPGYRNIRKIIPAANQHPTEKPWQLAAHFIGLHAQPGETVLDPFMGSGSTGEAAIKLGRDFIGIELDPQFYDMATKRLARVERQGDLFNKIVGHEYSPLF